MRRRLVFDIESNGLYDDVTKLWVVRACNIDTLEKYSWVDGDNGWMSFLADADLLIGHNIIDYDLAVLKKLFGFEYKGNIHDTLIMSRAQNYKRFGMKGHSLEVWGEYLGFPKIDFHDFDKYSEEMDIYCENDVELNRQVYEILIEEYKEIVSKSPQFKVYMQSEHYVAKWCTTANKEGWPFNRELGERLFDALDKELRSTESILLPKMGSKAVAVDKLKGEVEVKIPKYNKNGSYNHHVANWFDIDPELGQFPLSRPIVGPYCRVVFRDLKLSSDQDVKLFLYRHGWEPDEWNYKFDPDTRRRVKTSPKITETSLEFLGGDGKLYTEYTKSSSRYNNLKTWLENLDEDDRIHGDCNTIGTPSMRLTHKVVVNVPGVDAKWGKEMRQLFTCPEGYCIVGADSAGNQGRGLAHYLKDEEYITTMTSGDIHTYNAERMSKVVSDILSKPFTVTRGGSKRIYYAFLFGASGAKMWGYALGKQDKKLGAAFKKGFENAVPGLSDLLGKLERIYGATKKKGNPYIISITGGRVYVDSPHKLLVYLLQSCEKATCAAALMYTMKELEKREIWYQPLIFMHDEIQLMVKKEHSEEVAEISATAFKEAPKWYGIDIMDGASKVGKDWYETH